MLVYGKSPSGVPRPLSGEEMPDGTQILPVQCVVIDTDTGEPVRLTKQMLEAGGGVTDHGSLTGLSDDDHSQYHTDARGDVRYEKIVGNVVTVAAVGGDYTSIAAAYAAIIDAGPTNPYTIRVGPGEYYEPVIVTKPYVNLTGEIINSVYIYADAANHHVFQIEEGPVEISFSAVYGAGAGYAGFAINSCGDYALLHKISLSECDTCIQCRAVTDISNIYLEYVDCSGNYNIGIDADNSGNSFDLFINVENYYGIPETVNTTDDFIVSGATTLAVVPVAGFYGFGSGNGIRVEDGAELETASCIISGYATGLSVPNVGSGPRLEVNGLIAEGNTIDISIAHANCNGAISGQLDRTKATIHADAVLALNYSDSTNQSFVIAGDLYLGPRQSSLSKVTGLITKGSTMGVRSGGGLSAGAGLVCNIALGEADLQDNTDSYAVNITWTADTITLPANSASYVYYDNTGAKQSNTTLPNIIRNAVLGRVITDGSTIVFIDRSAYNASHSSNYLHQMAKEALGAVYVSGSDVAEGTTARTLNVTSGKYYLAQTAFNPSGGSPVNLIQYYHSSGTWTYSTASNQVSNTQYDNGTNLTSLTSGWYTNHCLLIVGDGATEKYFIVYGQEQFATLAEVQNAAMPMPPDFFIEGVAELGCIIVQEGQSAIVEIQSHKPVIGFQASGINIALLQQKSEKNQASGYAGLDATTKIATSQIPSHPGIHLHNMVLSGNTSGAMATISSGTATIAGGANITLSQAGNAFTIIGGAGGGALAAIGNTASSNAFTSGSIIFSGLANITVNTSVDGGSQYIQLSAPGAGGDAIRALSVSNTSYSGSTITLGNSNGISFYGTNGSIVASHNALTSQSNQAVSGSNGSFTWQTVTFGNSNGVTFYTTNGSMVASHNALTSQSNQAISGSNGSFTWQTVTFGNLNGMSFYTSNGSLVGSYTVPTQTVQTQNLHNVTLSGNTVGAMAQISSGTMTLAGGANITLSQAGNAVTIVGAAGGGGMGISAAGNSISAGTLVFSNSNGVSFGMNGSTITATVVPGAAAGIAAIGNTASSDAFTSGSVMFSGLANITVNTSINGASQYIQLSAPAPGGGGGLTLSRVDNLGHMGTLSRGATSNATFFIVPLIPDAGNVFPGNGTFSRIAFQMSGSNTATSASSGAFTHSISVGLYTVNASSFSLVNSGSLSFTAAAATGNTSLYHGPRWLTLANTNFATTDLTFAQGSQYYLAYWYRTSGQALSVSFLGASRAFTSGQASGFMYTSTATATWMGAGFNIGGQYSASFSSAMPGSLRWDTGATNFNRAVALADFIPVVRLETYTNPGLFCAV